MSRDGTKQDRGSRPPPGAKVLITGGAGFIGTNLAHRLLVEKRHVRILDNLSRPGVEKNLDWLVRNHDPQLLEVRIQDIRDVVAVEASLDDVGEVFHLAAQVAVTTSIEQPLDDFDINVRGTLHLLEAMRRQPQPPVLIYTSTNKVYGNLENLSLQRNGTRYEPDNDQILKYGVNETQPLQFWSPYGCSKGTADQYVLDYARVYGLKAVVFRMSCIYGPHQFGTEDQGWVAHFLIRGHMGQPITIYGDGMQVRDILYVEDLVDAFLAARQKALQLSGQAFNIGGGPQNTLSLVELLQLLEELEGKPPLVKYAEWRSGDQRYFVADTRLFNKLTQWSARVDVRAGVNMLHTWFQENQVTSMSLNPRHKEVNRIENFQA
jgi:CDP-paratose 2-epimerase